MIEQNPEIKRIRDNYNDKPLEDCPPTMIVIPTYNELENISRIIPAILGINSNIKILVVDDNSPDGTGQYVDNISKNNPRVHILHRAGKLGLGSAYIEGFKYALKTDAELIFEMDADFSHEPERIPSLIQKAKECDLVIGSRYAGGKISVINWPLSRLILSYGANLYTRIVTGLTISDSTGGFKCFHRRVLEALDLDSIESDGYAFQIEVNFKVTKKGFKIGEVPIIFVDRHAGTSKMSRHIVWEAFWLVWKLRIMDIIGKI